MAQKQVTNTQKFQKKILDFYAVSGRHVLPWRQTSDPYRILVSEVMLQQTQVERVIPKYEAFLRAFPDVFSLAKAPVSSVLALWIGLGYNRRALYLKRTAEAIVERYGGIFPQTEKELQALPGIGAYTASAICAFAYNQSVVCIETNIRRVYIHEFFPERDDVSDKELLPHIQASVYHENPRQWYWALMDYGSHLKKSGVNPNRRSAHYSKQSTFVGSVREVRGAIIRLCTEGSISRTDLFSQYKKVDSVRVQKALDSLVKDQMISVSKAGKITLKK